MRSLREKACMSHYRRVLCGLMAPICFSACSKEPQKREGEPTQADRERFSGRYLPPPTPPRLPAVSPSTGDPDHDFLRRMSDHHKDLIRITHAAVESNRDPSLQPAIRKLEEDHDHELDDMLALLHALYKDAYVPQTNPANDFTAEILRKPGTNYIQVFLATALNSEEEAVGILNEYLPKAKNREVRNFARKLRSEEAGEMAALRSALSNH
jgi:uncharacterized protein (DUF305 family)